VNVAVLGDLRIDEAAAQHELAVKSTGSAISYCRAVGKHGSRDRPFFCCCARLRRVARSAAGCWGCGPRLLPPAALNRAVLAAAALYLTLT